MSVTLKPGLRRLLHDLAELERDPVPGVDVYVDDKHMTKMCAVLTPMSGRFAGVRIHLVVRIGEQYPKIGPEVREKKTCDSRNIVVDSVEVGVDLQSDPSSQRFWELYLL